MDALPPDAPAELCAVVEEFAEVREAMLVDAGVRLLFVVMKPGTLLDDPLRAAITARLRADEPSRRMPDAIYAAPELPRAAGGQVHEAAVRNIFAGVSPRNADGHDTAVLRYFVDLFNNL